MMTSFKKCLVMMIIMVVAITAFLMHYMEDLRNQRQQRPPMAVHRRIPNFLLLLNNEISLPERKHFCHFKPRSSEDAEEQSLLLKSLDWPESPLLSPEFPFLKTTCPGRSTFTIVPKEKGQEWSVGDKLEVMIKMYDFRGIPKQTGRDFIIARLHNPDLLAGVAGQITDNLDGSYSAVFPLLWSGQAMVEVTLVHPSDGVLLLRNLNQKSPDRIKFIGVFHSGRISVKTVCNVCLRPAKKQVCNFTDVQTGEPWFCYKPTNLSCDTRVVHTEKRNNITMGPYKTLFHDRYNRKIPIPPSGPGNISVLPADEDDQETVMKIRSSGVSGYYYKDVWHDVSGPQVQHFNDSTAISNCLEGKDIHFYGDASVRQWYEYLNKSLPDLKEFNLQNTKIIGPFMALDYERNIYVEYQCHGPPIRFSQIPVVQLVYIANNLDDISGGANTVVVLGIGSHFSSFSLEIYIRRLQSIRSAVIRLLRRAPHTLVVIRTSNLKKLLPYETLVSSDFYSMEQDKILRAVFKDVNVRWVDAWEMTLAHYLPHELHPQPPIVKNMMDVLLSYICPLQKT